MNIDDQNLTQFVKVYKYGIFIGLCSFILAYIIMAGKKKARNNYPPGPVGLPIFGYLPFLSKEVFMDFTELGKKYGDVFSVRIGSHDFVILHGGDAIMEAFKKPDFLGRPPKAALDRIRPYSAFFSRHFSLWQEQRRFVVQTMKDLGLGKTRIEEAVRVEMNNFMDILRSCKTKPVDISKPLSSSISNNICSLIIGKRFEFDDPVRQFLDKNIDELFQYVSDISMTVLFPWLEYIPFASKFLESQKTWTANENLERFFRTEINEHSKTIDRDNVRDFIDRYLIEIDTQKTKNSSASFNNNMLMHNCVDIFVAGSHPIELTIFWFIYVVAAFPDVQKKVQKEIIEVIGSEREPKFMDMKNMPYTHSVMLEIMRWKPILPLNLPHYTLADTTVGGYHVPKGKIVIANTWAVHHDPRYWEEPESFKPERFLSKDGKSVEKLKYFMPFSRGSRKCPGESMAFLELFIYFTSILQEFDVAFPAGTKPTFDAKFVLDYNLESYLVRIIPKK